MPRTGTPAPSRPAGAGGAPSAYTEAGPPDRMIAFGFRARICAPGMLDGTISEYTWHSLTRRAISCAYWAPKSTTRTVSNSGAECTIRLPGPAPRPLLSAPPRQDTASLGAPGTDAARLAGLPAAHARRGRCQASPRWRGAPGVLRNRGHGVGLPVGGGGAHPYPGDAAGVHLGHGQPVAVDLDRVTHRWQPPQSGENIPGHRLVRSFRQADPGLLGELVEVEQAVHLYLAAVQPARAALLGVVLVLDIPDQLLHQVFQGHDPRRAAVLVHHDRQVRAVPPHLGQRGQHPLADRQPLHRPDDLTDQQFLVRQPGVEQVTDVHKADHVVVGLLVDGEPGVRGAGGDLGGAGQRRVGRDELHLGARQQDLTELAFARVEHVGQDLPLVD